MAIGAYTKTTWANSPSTSSPLSAANLQHIEDQVKDITDAAVSGGASPTKIWTSTNDGNGGQPPAPKPFNDGPAYTAGTYTPGRVLYASLVGDGSTPYYYSGLQNKTGTWEMTRKRWNTSTGAFVDEIVEIGSGSYSSAAPSGYTFTFVCRRLS